MATRAQVIELIEAGHSYETAAKELGIPSGLAFMIATGLPADGGEAQPPPEPEQEPALNGSSQQLVNPPTFNPTRKPELLAWVKRRAARELKGGA
jgi:hypothetical protein